MHLQEPEKPKPEHLRKQAAELPPIKQQGRLADAQRALAGECRFASRAQLKPHVESLNLTSSELLREAVCGKDASRIRGVLEHCPEQRAKIDDSMPDYGFDKHSLFSAVQRNDRATVGVLLGTGANTPKRTEWCSGGLGIFDDRDPRLVDFLIAHGLVLDIHSTSRLGLMANFSESVTADLNVVHEPSNALLEVLP
jgi:hypothetical protein